MKHKYKQLVQNSYTKERMSAAHPFVIGTRRVNFLYSDSFSICIFN